MILALVRENLSLGFVKNECAQTDQRHCTSLIGKYIYRLAPREISTF